MAKKPQQSLPLVLLVVVLLSQLSPCLCAWGFGEEHKKVLLKDVEVITLRHGQQTTGRRSSPVPQLSCVGGSAAGKFTPQVVQCYNRGWDGVDVQWECKTDMDNAFRLGEVTVICEGFDYPDDPYILKGSCGLEYTLDYTMEGKEKASYHDYYGGASYTHQDSSKSWQGMKDLLLLGVIGIVIYAFYKTCLSNEHVYGDRQYSSTDDDPRGSPGGGGWYAGGGGGDNSYGNNYGGRGNYYGGSGYDDASCRRRNNAGGGGGGGGGGFWTGMATGGLMGYMFGNRGHGGGYGGYNRGWGGYGGYNRGYGGWGSSGWGGGGWGGGGSGYGRGYGGGASSSGSSSSSGTRTASGFGGTRRR